MTAPGMNDSRAAVPEPVASWDSPSVHGATSQRLAWLFRHSLRAGCVHPAMHLLQRHRGASGALQAPQSPKTEATKTIATRYPIDANALAQHVSELPALPQVVVELLELLRDDAVGSTVLAEHVEQDQSLTAQALRLANSPFYGVSGRVGTVRDAIQVLGLGTVGTLLTTVAITGQFATAARGDFDFRGFWRHALATGIAARELARRTRLNPDLAFVAGLLHDIGLLVVAVRFQAPLAAVFRCLRLHDMPILEAEALVLSCDHTTVGAAVAAHWRLPPEIVRAISEHHAPSDSDGHVLTITDLVHVADALAHGLDLAAVPGEAVPGATSSAWCRMGLNDEQIISALAKTEDGALALYQALAL